jgi:hypothetical protein
MIFLLFSFCFICVVAYYLIKDTENASQEDMFDLETLDVKTMFNEEDLKKEFTHLFKEVYASFSTGKLGAISPQISPELARSLQESIRARDEAQFMHSFKSEPVCTIQDIAIGKDNVVSIKAEFKSEQAIEMPNMDPMTDNVVDMLTFEKKLSQRNTAWKLVRMG